MTDQKQAPDTSLESLDRVIAGLRPMNGCNEMDAAVIVIEALAKERDELAGTIETLKGLTRSQAYGYSKIMVERDELAAKLKYHQHEVVDTHAANEADALARAEKAEAERDELAADLEAMTKIAQAQRDHADQALAASAAREIAMRDRAAGVTVYEGLSFGGKPCYYHIPDKVKAEIRALPLSPDGQQALDEMLADAWVEGMWVGLGEDSPPINDNPYRTQPSRSSDAGKSEDRG